MSRNNIYFYDTHAQRFVDLEEDDANIIKRCRRIGTWLSRHSTSGGKKMNTDGTMNLWLLTKKKKPFSKGELLNNDRLCLRNSLSDCTWYTLYKLMCRAL